MHLEEWKMFDSVQRKNLSNKMLKKHVDVMNLLNGVNHISEIIYLISSFRRQNFGESLQLSPLFH